jgi:tRNA threonylcarbamoyladenosine biosynthesis protein TsaE
VLLPYLPAHSLSPADTERIGRNIGEVLGPGDVVALYGDLGAGKTHLARGICAGLGGDADQVSSPTFALVQTYDTQPLLHHIDAYRLDDADAFRAIGGDELLWDEGVCVVEWPSRIEPLLPPHTVRLALTHEAAGGRRIEQIDGPPNPQPTTPPGR